MLKALITGISGFVGSYLAEYLLEQPDWQVAGTVFGPYANIADLCGRLELYPAELSRPDVMTFILEQCRPDVIFHLAAQPLVQCVQAGSVGHARNEHPGAAQRAGGGGASQARLPGVGGRLGGGVWAGGSG